jgi:hypothetical protein
MKVKTALKVSSVAFSLLLMIFVSSCGGGESKLITELNQLKEKSEHHLKYMNEFMECFNEPFTSASNCSEKLLKKYNATPFDAHVSEVMKDVKLTFMSKE